MSTISDHMRRAIALARQALGTTSPNPSVGAVVVKDGVVVGEGSTQPPGQPHAEVMALRQAGEASRGASLYVTLEPCSLQGRTSPCTLAVIEAGVRRVVAATLDPNPKVDGQGVAELRDAGIEVLLGDGQEEAQELYEGFAKHVNTGMPFSTAKFAMSLDGKIATRSGDSKWITGTLARRYVQEMRRTSDAIMVGVGTLLRDDPKLTSRDESGAALARQPIRVVLDSTGRTPTNAQLLKEPGHTLVAVAHATNDRVDALAAAGAEILRVPSTGEELVDPCALFRVLGARGLVNVLVEGGGTLLGFFFDLRLVDKVTAFVAPTVIGGAAAPSPVGGEGSGDMSQVMRLSRVKVERLGEDILVIGYPPTADTGLERR